jgi:hypothetical protein
MKKKLLICALMIQSSSAFAQNSRSEINSLISSWIIPVVGLLMLIGFLALVVHNIDGLRGKNGLSKQDAWIAVGEGMIFVVVGISAFGYVASRLASMNFQV